MQKLLKSLCFALLFAPSCAPKDDVEESSGIWSGPSVIFEKLDDADPQDPANQDKITESVALTRLESGALINILVEELAIKESPSGTLWAQGTTADIESLEFEPLKTAAGDQMRTVPGKSFVLYLTQEDIYIDLTFISWKPGKIGGGFSYERSTR